MATASERLRGKGKSDVIDAFGLQGRGKKKRPLLELVRFSNRSGSTSFRIKGTIRGARIRRNFAQEVDARIFAREQIGGLVGGTQRRSVETTLTDEQLADAEAFAHDLPTGATAQKVLKFFLDHHRPIRAIPLLTVTVQKNGKAERQLGAIDEYAEFCLGKRKNLQRTIDQRTHYLTKFKRDANVTLTTDITEDTASGWIYKNGSEHTQRDHYDELNRFAKYLVKRRYLLANPIADLPRPIVRLKTPSVLTFDQIWTLLQCALTDAEGPQMLPFFAIAGLSGVRPQEVTELGTKNDGTKSDGWDNIHLEEEHRVIEVNKTKGGLSRRNAEICDPLWRILTWCKAHGLAANYFSKRKFDRIRRRADVFDVWEHDVLRHSYASYCYALSKDTRALTGNMGNTERVLFDNYIRPVPRTEAVCYFGLALDWQAPRERSLEGQRLDRWLTKPLDELPVDRLRILHSRIAGEYARLCRKRVMDAGTESVRKNFEAVRRELRRRGLLPVEEDREDKRGRSRETWLPEFFAPTWEQARQESDLLG